MTGAIADVTPDAAEARGAAGVGVAAPARAGDAATIANSDAATANHRTG